MDVDDKEERGSHWPRMVDTLPPSIDVAAFLRRMEINARAEQWPACAAALEDLQREARLARPASWSYAEKLRASCEQIGIDERMAQKLATLGVFNVVDLLYVRAAKIDGAKQIGPQSIAAVRDCLVRVLADTPDEALARTWPNA